METVKAGELLTALVKLGLHGIQRIANLLSVIVPTNSTTFNKDPLV